MLSLWWPHLAGVVQPLAGEWAARRSLMESLSIPVGYGVELSTLLDTVGRHGLDALAQVDLGSRAHRHQANHDLAVMAAELLAVAERRKPGPHRLSPDITLEQFVREDGQVVRRSRSCPWSRRGPGPGRAQVAGSLDGGHDERDRPIDGHVHVVQAQRFADPSGRPGSRPWSASSVVAPRSRA